MSCWLPFLHAQDQLSSKENTIVSKKESAVTEQEAADNKQIKLALEKIGSKDYDLAIDIFQQLLKKHSNIKDYLHYNLAKAYLGKEQKEESKIQFTKVLDYSPNLKLMIDTHMQLGRLAKDDKKYKEAKKWFAAIEKRGRGQEIYAELIYNLAQVEFNAGSKETCKWARKLYSEYPHFSGVETWSVDLRKNKFDDKEIKCTTQNTDIQKRLRRLDLVGKSTKAGLEIEQLKLLTTDLGISKYAVAKIEAGHWLHDGDVLKSIQILKSFEKEKESDPEYQIDLASLYSRSNELTQSAELYYNIFQKYRKSKWAKESLFQSAFLSYQTQNYSEAEKKFYEYQKLYGDKGGRLKDIKWYLGWCRYLSKDYRGAISQWEEILKTKSKKNLSKDKILYWKSMAHLRMGEVERAFNSLKELSDDKLLGYYSLLAQHRLQKIESLIPKRKLAIKDASIIKKLNETEFQNSISCLLESASESYCNAVDSRNLLNKSLKEMVEEEKIPGSVLQANNNAAFYGGIKNPFTGIYILNHHIPNISQWLQKVQIGIDPKLPTDSDFKNDTIQIVSDYLQKVNSLKAEYYKQLETIRGFTDEKARSNQVYQLVKSLTSEMIGGRKSSQVNFFLLARNDIELPFALLGIPVPDPVKGIGVAMPVDYDRYLATHPEIFATAPLKIAESIGSNLNQIISAADGASIEYYSKWFIVDKAALVSEATTSMQYTVIDSLKALKNYLELLIEKFERFNGNKTDVPAIIETIDRIEKVLAKIDNLMVLSNEMSSAIAHIDPKTKKLVRLNGEATLKLSDEYRLKIANAYTDVINEIFEQFNVMLSRSGFLSTKFQLWVMSDYSLMLKNKIQLSDYEQSLFISMGNTAVDRISFLLSGNPSTTKDDLDNALRIHKENLLAIESTFKERWYTYTEVAKLISEGKSTAKEIKAAVKDRLDKEYSFMGISSKYLPPIAPMNVIKAILDIAKLWKEYTHPDLYQIPSTMVNTTKYIRENEFHSMNQVYSKMCVQALAFQDQTMFKTLCANAKLISPFSEVAPTSAKLASLNMSYSGRLLNSEKNPTTAETQRICAFRDYHRGNLVQKLTIGRPK